MPPKKASRASKGKGKAKEVVPVGRKKGGNLAITTDTKLEWYREDYDLGDRNAISNRRNALYTQKFGDRATLPPGRIDLEYADDTPLVQDFLKKLKFQGWDDLLQEEGSYNEEQVAWFTANMHVSCVNPPVIHSFVSGKKIRNLDPALLATILGIRHNNAWLKLGYPLTPKHERQLKRYVIDPDFYDSNWDRASHLNHKARVFQTWSRKLLCPKKGAAGEVPLHMLHMVYGLIAKEHIQFTTFILEEWIRVYHSTSKLYVFPHFISKVLQHFRIDIETPAYKVEIYRLQEPSVKGKEQVAEEEEEYEEEEEEEEEEAGEDTEGGDEMDIEEAEEEYGFPQVKDEFAKLNLKVSRIGRTGRETATAVNKLSWTFGEEMREMRQDNSDLKGQVLGYFDYVTPGWRAHVPQPPPPPPGDDDDE